jgi:molybdopterin-guanine dinucleotide biosynthesis protein A
MLNYSVVILAGGKSSRMGEDKALMPFLGSSLLDFILSQISDLGEERIIISNTPDDYQRFGLPVFKDVIPDIGALGGIYSALTYASFQHCLLFACDMPFVNQPLIKHMANIIPEFDAVIPRLRKDEFAEPFRAFYSKNCISSIQIQIKKGERKVVSFFDSVSIRYLEAEEIHKFDPQELTFFNVNTPEDMAKAIKLAQRK